VVLRSREKAEVLPSTAQQGIDDPEDGNVESANEALKSLSSYGEGESTRIDHTQFGVRETTIDVGGDAFDVPAAFGRRPREDHS
jgi:hypothetical protein